MRKLLTLDLVHDLVDIDQVFLRFNILMLAGFLETRTQNVPLFMVIVLEMCTWIYLIYLCIRL